MPTRTWRQVGLQLIKDGGRETRWPPVRTGHCTTVHAGRLLLFGGLDDGNQLLDDVAMMELIT